MTAAQRPGTFGADLAENVIHAREPDILFAVHEPGTAAAIWQRTPDAGFQAWIDGLPVGQLPEMAVSTPVHLVEAAVIAACETVDMPSCQHRDWIASDAAALALMLAKVLKSDWVRVRLDVAEEAMCPKFHIDNVPARLLCTYRGPGTEYVPARHQEDRGLIRTVKTGAVGLFRGRVWPDAEDTGLMHRSPAVGVETGARLLLVVDPAE